MRTLRYIPLIITTLCLLSLLFIQIWHIEEDSIYLDNTGVARYRQADEIKFPTQQWRTTSDYFMKSKEAGQHSHTQNPTNIFYTPSTTSSHTQIARTSDAEWNTFGGGFQYPMDQQVNRFTQGNTTNGSLITYHKANNANNNSQATADINKATSSLQIASASKLTSTVYQTAFIKMPTVTPMAVTTFDANYKPFDSNLKLAMDDPFGGEDVEGTPNPDEPGLPLGDMPWALLAILTTIYVGICKKKQSTEITN